MFIDWYLHIYYGFADVICEFFFSPTVSTDIWNQFQCLNVVLNNKTGPSLVIRLSLSVFTIVTTKRVVQHTLRHFNVLTSLSETNISDIFIIRWERKKETITVLVITEILRLKNEGARPNLGKHP